MNKSFILLEEVDNMIQLLTESKLSREEHLLNIVNLLKFNKIKSKKVSFLLKDIKSESDDRIIDFELLERGGVFVGKSGGGEVFLYGLLWVEERNTKILNVKKSVKYA